MLTIFIYLFITIFISFVSYVFISFAKTLRYHVEFWVSVLEKNNYFKLPLFTDGETESQRALGSTFSKFMQSLHWVSQHFKLLSEFFEYMWQWLKIMCHLATWNCDGEKKILV